jgi:ubiquinone/menaquinone biosynthesis C-methylase UbiE
MDDEGIIRSARQGFDARLHGDEYRKIHSDAEQLERLLSMFDMRDGASYLDLGTGNGYIAFDLASRHRNVRVCGLDIAEGSIERDKEIARERGLDNLKFRSYGGLEFPFDDRQFFGGISRYAVHHFPDIRRSLAELRRVTQEGGFFILSDPETAEEDKEGFVDRFQSLLPDGHIHFYRRSEIEALFREFGFVVEQGFPSSIRYPRTLDERYRELIEGIPKGLSDKYAVEIAGEQVFIRVDVMNLLFRLNPV